MTRRITGRSGLTVLFAEVTFFAGDSRDIDSACTLDDTIATPCDAVERTLGMDGWSYPCTTLVVVVGVVIIHLHITIIRATGCGDTDDAVVRGGLHERNDLSRLHDIVLSNDLRCPIKMGRGIVRIVRGRTHVDVYTGDTHLVCIVVPSVSELVIPSVAKIAVKRLVACRESMGRSGETHKKRKKEDSLAHRKYLIRYRRFFYLRNRKRI